MNIVVCAEDFPDNNHPSYVFVSNIVIALANREHNITVIAPQSITKHIIRRVPLFKKIDIRKTNINKEYLVYRPFFFSFGSFPIFSRIGKFLATQGVNRVLKSLHQKPDVLYGHFWSMAMCLKPFAKNNNLPLFVACGEGDDALEDMAKKMSSRQKFNLSKAISGVICVSSENKRKCLEYGLATLDQIIVLPNSADQSVFFPMDKNQCRKMLSVSDDDFIVSFVGGFINRKGSDRLSKAIDLLDRTNLKVFFIGKPSPSLEDCTPNCNGILHLGPVNNSKIPIYLNASDVFVLPTLNEGCSNAIVEALSCGIPVISSDAPFNDDILNDKNSIRINSQNIIEISDAISKLMDNRQLICKLSEGAMEKSKELSIENRVERIESFLLTQISRYKGKNN